MRQVRLRQIVRLEQLAQPYVDRKQQTEDEWQSIRQGAAAHAAVLAFVIRYGNPRIDEPLSCAWQRCSKSSAWKECSQRFKSSLMRGPRDREYPFRPDDRNRTLIMGRPLRHVVIGSFPGADEKEKLDAVFASAPPWLLWFTFGDYTAELLGLTLPNLSRVAGFARSKANFDLWFGLPSGAFERRPWPDGPQDEPLARTDLKFLCPEMQLADGQMTPRERRRARATYMKSTPINPKDDWPTLVPSEFLEMPFADRLALIEEQRRKAEVPRWRPGYY